MAGLTIKTVFSAVNKMTQPITTMQSQVGKFASAANHATAGIGAGFGRLRAVIKGALVGLKFGSVIKGFDASDGHTTRTACRRQERGNAS